MPVPSLLLAQRGVRAVLRWLRRGVVRQPAQPPATLLPLLRTGLRLPGALRARRPHPPVRVAAGLLTNTNGDTSSSQKSTGQASTEVQKFASRIYEARRT